MRAFMIIFVPARLQLFRRKIHIIIAIYFSTTL